MVIFLEKSGSELQKTKNLPKNGRCVKWVPKHQRKHWFYNGWRSGARNVVFCAKGVEFRSFRVLGAQNRKNSSFAEFLIFPLRIQNVPKKGARIKVFRPQNQHSRKVRFCEILVAENGKRIFQKL